jgi:catechol 2,3-dioxygenase-like lactoylglutathione lyase family enzyme
MTKLLGPDFISLQVRDLSTSRAFYTGVLGLTVDPQFETPEVIVFDSTTIPFALRQSTVNLDEAIWRALHRVAWLNSTQTPESCSPRTDAAAPPQ